MTAENVNEEEPTEVEETEEVTTEENDNEAQEETLESLKAKLEEKEKALKKANAERTRLGKKLKATPEERGVPTLTDAAKRAFVVAELRAKGLNDSQAKRLSKLVALEDIDLDDDGDVTGIDLDEIEEDFADLFNKPSEIKKTVRKVTTGDKSNSASPPSGLSEVTKKMLSGNY